MLLLIAAIMLLRRVMNRLGNRTVFSKELLIVVHAFLFGGSTCCYIMNRIADKYFAQSEELPEACKWIVTMFAFSALEQWFNSAILILLTYMSIQFMKPLEGQWQ